MGGDKEFKEFENLPEGWKRVRLGEVSHITMGQSPDSTLINNEGIGVPFLQGNAEFTTKHPLPINWIKKTLKTAIKNSILISVRAPIGDLNIADRSYCIGRGLASINVNSVNSTTLFIWYILHFFNDNLIKLGQGSTFDAIGFKDLKTLIIPLPQLSEQRKIAEILKTIDNAIEKTDKIIEKYKRIKQGLMQDLLTKGIDENGNIRDEKTHRFKDLPLGRIPEEWEVVRLGEVGEIITGSTPPTENSEYYGDEYLFISPEDIQNKKYIENTTKKLTKLGMNIQRKISPMSICVVCIGSTIGKIAITKYECSTNQQINTIIPNLKLYDPEALYYFINFHIQSPLKIEAGLQAVPIVKKSAFSKIPLPLPPLPEQQRIAEILTQTDQTIEKEQQYKEKLQKIKQGLMQDLLTGKVRVNHLINEGQNNEA